VFCFDERGRQLWQIGEIVNSFPIGLYAAIDVTCDGVITAVNEKSFTATLDPSTGAVVHVKRGAW
jgi:hypothetical protein